MTFAELTAEIRVQLHALGNPDKASFLQGFFKTRPGEYGAGDVFIGLTVPVVRGVLRTFRGLPPEVLLPLLKSPFHEERLFALLGLVRCFQQGDGALRRQVYADYLANSTAINNWDLVDCSAPQIVGGYLLTQDREPLYRLVGSGGLWERRIAVLATFTFIRAGQYDDILELARLLLPDRHDLIHKAVGWMLREVGKREQRLLEDFLQRHCRVMPRTMLRYAIERFPRELRQRYLSGEGGA